MTNKIHLFLYKITYHTEGDRTVPDRDLAYDKLIGNTSINVNEIVREYKMFDEYYNEYNYILYLSLIHI